MSPLAPAAGAFGAWRSTPQIHDASIANLPRAIREAGELRVYDNSATGRRPVLVMAAQNGSIKLCLYPEIRHARVQAESGSVANAEEISVNPASFMTSCTSRTAVMLAPS